MRRLTDEYCRFLAWNAAQPKPMPICRKCQSPIDPSSHAEFMDGWCFCCEVDLVYNRIRHAIRVFGPRLAKRRLRALASRRWQLALQGAER